MQNNEIRVAHEVCAMMRKAAIFAHHSRRSARISRPLGGRAEWNHPVAGDRPKGPARVAEPDGVTPA